DANKPGGSIKIRVKTYAHSLSLHEERLHDAAKQREKLAIAIDEKRLELMKLKQAQLSARKQADPELNRQVEELAKKLAEYKAPKKAPQVSAEAAGLVTLKKKTADGRFAPALGTPTETPPRDAASSAAELLRRNISLIRRVRTPRRLSPAHTFASSRGAPRKHGPNARDRSESEQAKPSDRRRNSDGEHASQRRRHRGRARRFRSG
ncbi:MAG: hypothetical protein U0165_17850, partial [Polyangiaceae bacterium]